MAIQLAGLGGAVAEVDPTFNAQRHTIRPYEVSSWVSVGLQTGLITGIAANGAIFSLRNASTKLLLLRRLGVGFIATTAFTTAQRMDLGLVVARNFTASDAGGTAVGIFGTGINKHRTSLSNLSAGDARISTTAALTAGTKTLDTFPLGQVGAWVGAIGQGIAPTPSNLLAHDTGDYPLVLAPNEGINVLNLTAMGAGGVGIGYVNFELAEAASF